MLPERSKRYASPEGEIPRLTLTSTWQLVLMALLVLTLLVLIYPHKALVDSLYQHDELDELTLSYIHNLYRTEPENADVALLLARTQPGLVREQRLQDTLLRLTADGSERQRRQARQLLLQANQQALAQAGSAAGSAAERAAVRQRLVALIERASHDVLLPHEAQMLAQQAFELNQPVLGAQLFEQLIAGQSSTSLEAMGDLVLGQGYHALAARYFMQARERAADTAQARRLFQKGIQAYMQASLFAQAMQAAQHYLGDLAHDLPTLRYLARSALAAGQPALAARYARQLVFVGAPQERP